MSTLDALKPSEYPIVTLSVGRDYLDERRNVWVPGNSPTVVSGADESRVQTRATDGDYDPTAVGSLVADLQSLASEFPANVSAVKDSRNLFDLEAAKRTYEHLRALPLPVLFDKDFWRYLTLHELFSIVIWRMPYNEEKVEGWRSNFGLGTNWPRCYPYKSYLRGQLIATVRERGYPWVDQSDVDFYDSHLFSSRNGLIPSVASALNTIRQDDAINRSRDLQPYVTTAVNYRATHATEVLDPAEAEAVLRRYST